MASFRLASRLKAAEEVMSEEMKGTSWKVWLFCCCHVWSLRVLVLAGFNSAGSLCLLSLILYMPILHECSVCRHVLEGPLTV